MKRREFITLAGGAAAAWPLTARAQQPPAKLPVVGFFHSDGQDASGFRVTAFRQGLNEAGYVEGQNAAVEYRWGEGHGERLPALAAELIDRKVAVICAGDVLAARAAKAVAGTTPIVFLTASDPVEDGLVASFNQPGGNATGIRIFSAGLVGKRLQLLHDLVPTAAAVGFLMNPSNPTAATQVKDVQAAAGAIGMRIHVVSASDEREFDTVFETLVQQKVDALLVGADPRFNSQREQLIRRAARDRLPAVYEWRESAIAGGLMSYGTSLTDAFRNLGVYAGQILKGAKPSELPVMQQTRFELVINLKTARALGLTVPPTLLARADEVIE
jgi:putative tryptophan/tyrosine transport system substrate-binding protein